EFGPALRIDAYRGAQVDQRFLEAFRPHVLPPVDVAGMPLLQRALDAHVLAQADIVRNQPVVIDLADAGGDVHGSCPLTAVACPGRGAARSDAPQTRDPGSLLRQPGSRISGAPFRCATRCTASGTRKPIKPCPSHRSA